MRTELTPGDLTGLVIVDKEPGWTSHDVVARCRRLLGQRRVGHAGTLDPDATGLLLVGLGRFTRMLRFLSSLEKRYEAELVLGAATSTLDASGELLETWDMSSVTLADVRAVAKGFVGTILQVPPMVSAIKIGGRRLHQLARSGIEVERAPRAVEVRRLDIFESQGEGAVFRMEIECGSGTYVRSLAADLGTALGGGAHLRNLRRTNIGSFGTDEAHKLEDLQPALVLTPAQALRDMPQVEIGSELSRLVSHGLALDKVALGAQGTGPWALVDHRGRLLAVYEGTETDRIVASCVLAAGG